LGLLHAAVGSIPPQFKWGVELLSSLQGSIREGQREMEKALGDTSSPFYRETAVLNALVKLHLSNDAEAAWRDIQSLGLQPNTNKLHCFVVANIAMRSGRNDLAIDVLEAQPRGGTSDDFAYLDFMLGMAKLRALDYGARLYFQSFLFRFDGQHFIKEAVQKIAWAELLRGREDLYLERIGQVNQKGNATAGGDMNASNEAASATLPHLDLLRARLLFDGGYFARARKLMDRIDPILLATDELQLEYYYRTGRILHGLKDYSGALSFYERTIAQGRDEEAFFACNAALQAGLIQELLNDKSQAKRYYELCLSMSPEEYRLGLHIQAKAGLNRL
jgi:tetratricopeptide (TPR) repeat protein